MGGLQLNNKLVYRPVIGVVLATLCAVVLFQYLDRVNSTAHEVSRCYANAIQIDTLARTHGPLKTSLCDEWESYSKAWFNKPHVGTILSVQLSLWSDDKVTPTNWREFIDSNGDVIWRP
jgi:hypothetical protein